jgi:hypothetical protein
MNDVQPTAPVTHASPQGFQLQSLTQRKSGPRNKSSAQLHRKEYLQALIRGEIPPLIEVYGQSASGKSTTIKLLHRTLGIEPSTRFITREPRSDDGWFERRWDLSHAHLPGGSDLRTGKGESQSPVTASHLAPSGTLFAIHNYGNYYGTSVHELVERLHTAGPDGISILMGKLVDLPNFHEAVSNVFPLFPFIPCRLMVDLFQLTDRLKRREARGNESRPGEVAERLNVLTEKFLEDQAQIPEYCALYGLRPLVAPIQSEVERFNLSNSEPLNEESIRAWLAPAMKEVKERSAELARDVLRPRTFPVIVQPSRAPALKLLQETLVPRAQRFGISEIYLTGEIGVAAYLAESALIPPSPINRVAFAVTSREDETARIGDLVATIMLHTHGEAHPVVEDARGLAATELRGSTAIEWRNHNMTLEGRMSTQIRPQDSLFCYEWKCDHADQILARTVRLPNGSHIAVVPPEHLLVENLLLCNDPIERERAAQRALGLLATQTIDSNVLHRLVFQQEVDKALDSACMDVVDRLRLSHPTATFGELCKKGLLTPDEVLGTLPQKLHDRAVDLTKLFDTPQDNTPASPLSLSAVKQLMLLLHLRQGLHGLRHLAERSESFLAGSLPESPPRERLIATIKGIERTLDNFMNFEVGRGDIFVRRDRRGRLDNFFRVSPTGETA